MRARLDAVREVWTATPHGWDAFLRSRDVPLAARVLAEIDIARDAVANLSMPPRTSPWEDGVAAGDETTGRDAYDALTGLERTLRADVGATLGMVLLDSDD